MEPYRNLGSAMCSTYVNYHSRFNNGHNWEVPCDHFDKESEEIFNLTSF